MKKKTSVPTLCLGAIAFIAAACGAVFYYLAATQNYDRTINHFEAGPRVTAFVCLFIAAAVCALASGVISRKSASVTDHGSYHPCVLAVYAVTGAAILSSAAVDIVNLIRAGLPTEVARDYVTSVAAPILAVFASLYFLLIVGKEKTETARTFFGIAAIAWSIVATLDVYFKKGEPINSAAKAILLVVSIVGLLFITEDMRFTLGTQTVGAYRAVASLCVCAGLTFAIPNCAIALTHMTSGGETYVNSPDFAMFPAAIAVLLALCAAVRLATFSSSLGDYVPAKHNKKKPADKTE